MIYVDATCESSPRSGVEYVYQGSGRRNYTTLPAIHASPRRDNVTYIDASPMGGYPTRRVVHKRAGQRIGGMGYGMPVDIYPRRAASYRRDDFYGPDDRYITGTRINPNMISRVAGNRRGLAHRGMKFRVIA